MDFATGTGTFLLDVIKQTLETVPEGSKAKRDLIIKEHILKNFYGFEYLIAPYTIAHLKISQYLHEQGYDFSDNERLQIFLTNTLEPVSAQLNFLLPQLSKEGEQAQKVKEKPILVITGNPPYSGHSKNNGEWISHKIKDYYFIDGAPLGEKNPKWLQDDYVKFIRFAQDKMESVEQGIIGVITNHRFLTNPTFRGMRQSLMNTFDQMYFIDLHGSNKPKETKPDGGKDENVFDIEQGVAISILIKKKGLEKKVFHADFWGDREEKYIKCLKESIHSIEWASVGINKKFNLFKPQNELLSKSYNLYSSVKEIFILSTNGIISKRDSLVIDFEKHSLIQKLKIFSDINKSDTEIAEHFQLPLKDNDKWILNDARKHIQETSIKDDLCVKIHYRPFDIRFIYFDDVLVARLVKKTMQNFLFENLGLICGRAGQNVAGDNWNLIFATKEMVDLNLYSRGGGTSFPLYSYSQKVGLFANSQSDNIEKIENITKEFRNFINNKYSKIYTPEEILGYIYAVLHSPIYRSKYDEFLKIDFPRIPFTDSSETFESLSVLGSELIQKHLLNQVPTDKEYKTLGIYKGDGNNTVEKPIFSPSPNGEGRGEALYINKTQYFNNVPEAVYNFHIGGYQVLDKYLKDRKTHTLTIDEIENVENIVKVLAFTIRQMEQIDTLTIDWI